MAMPLSNNNLQILKNGSNIGNSMDTHFITLQIDGQLPNLLYSNYITDTEKSVGSNDITN